MRPALQYPFKGSLQLLSSRQFVQCLHLPMGLTVRSLVSLRRKAKLPYCTDWVSTQIRGVILYSRIALRHQAVVLG